MLLLRGKAWVSTKVLPCGGSKLRYRYQLAGAWLLAALLAGILALIPALQRGDGALHDALIRRLQPLPAPPDITLVDIDERSLQELGPWPWPRSVLAELSAQLRARGARLQVWDMALPQSSADAPALAAQFIQPDVVLGIIPVLDSAVQQPPQEGRLPTTSTLEAGFLAQQPQEWAALQSLCPSTTAVRGYLGLMPELAQARAGHLAATPDADGRLRRLPAFVCWGAVNSNSPQQLLLGQLALAAASAYTEDAPWQQQAGRWPWEPAQWLHRGSWRFALDEQGRLPVPWQRPHQDWPAISASQLLLADSHSDFAPLPDLQGHIVLIGATALGLRDMVSTPFHPGAPGVSAHAEIMAAALHSPARWGHSPRWGAWLAALTVLVLGALQLRYSQHTGLRPLLAWLPALALAGAGPLLLGLMWLATTGALVSLLAPAIALLTLAFAQQGLQLLAHKQRNALLAQHLQSFVPPSLAQQIIQQLPNGQSLGQSHSGVVAALHVEGLERWVSQVDSLQALALIHALHTCAAKILQEEPHNARAQLHSAQGATLYLSWPEPVALEQAISSLQRLHQALAPILQTNALPQAPLLAYIAMESGNYLLGLVGASHGRRHVLLGPVANDIQGMLALCTELDSPLLLGPQAAKQLQNTQPPPGQPRSNTLSVQSLGQFLLLDQSRPRELFRLDLLDR